MLFPTFFHKKENNTILTEKDFSLINSLKNTDKCIFICRNDFENLQTKKFILPKNLELAILYSHIRKKIKNIYSKESLLIFFNTQQCI